MQAVFLGWKFGQHVYASLLMSIDSGTEVHSIVDSMPGENGITAWLRLVEQFDPALAHTNLNLMSRILAPPKGKCGNTSFLVDKREGMASARMSGPTDKP